jgi:hypothetical protein
MRDEPKGRNLDPIRPSDSVRLRARESDKAIGVADIIVASGQRAALKGRTYDCTTQR